MDAIAETVGRLEEGAAASEGREAKWSEIRELVQEKRQLAEFECRRLNDLDALVPAKEAVAPIDMTTRLSLLRIP